MKMTNEPNNYTAMRLADLKQYILKHHDDTEALAVYIQRQHPEIVQATQALGDSSLKQEIIAMIRAELDARA